MNDLISRQAAIANINKAIPEWSEDKEIAIDCLKNTPTAQSQQVTGKLNSDCISRRAAIDALGYGNEWEVLGITVIDKDDAERQIMALPSAQPEPQKWIDHNYYLECPSCKRYVTNRTPYCPYCGGRNE